MAVLAIANAVHGDSVSCRPVIHVWIKRFKEGRVQLDDSPQGGRPTTARNQEDISLVQSLAEQDEEIANEVGIANRPAFSIPTENLGPSKPSVVTVGTQNVAGITTDTKNRNFLTNLNLPI
nr:flj37770 protein [Hymenolepis microstoma]